MLITLFISLIYFFAPDQPKWQELSSFEIYPKVSIDKFDQMNDADIQKLPSKLADIKEAKKILSKAKPKSLPILWKGMAHLAIAKFKDGSSRKFLINTYGASFRDVTGKKDYTLQDNAEVWNAFISKYKPQD